MLNDSTSLFDLLTAFHEVMKGFKEESAYFVKHQEITVEDRIAVIESILDGREFATFIELFADVRAKLIAILTFMAILEMVKLHRICVRQSRLFSEIRIYRADPRADVQADEIVETTQSEIEIENSTTKVAAE